MVLRSLPMELHADAAEFIREDFLALRADHGGSLRAGCGWLDVRFRIGRNNRNAAAYCDKAIGIGQCGLVSD